MLIAKPIAFLTSERFYAIGLQKFSSLKKKIKISFEITKTQIRRQKKHERFHENEYPVHWASFECKWS